MDMKLRAVMASVLIILSLGLILGGLQRLFGIEGNFILPLVLGGIGGVLTTCFLEYKERRNL